MPVGFCFSVRSDDPDSVWLDKDYVADQMKLKWPSAQILKNSRDELRWSIPMMNSDGEYLVEGFQLFWDTLCLESPGSLENTAEFAIWVRSLIPDHFALIYWCTEGEYEVKIYPAMTEQQFMVTLEAAF